jgi:protein-disulfide isomerase
VEAVTADIAKAAGMDINGTPIIFVGETRVDGFDAPRLDSLLK